MKKAHKGAPVIDLRQHSGPMATYWTATVRRGRKGPILFTNSNASRDAALGGAQTWCRNSGHRNARIVEVG